MASVYLMRGLEVTKKTVQNLGWLYVHTRKGEGQRAFFSRSHDRSVGYLLRVLGEDRNGVKWEYVTDYADTNVFHDLCKPLLEKHGVEVTVSLNAQPLH